MHQEVISMGKTDRPVYRRGVYQDEKGREFYYDNAKFILILLVVLAHAISPLKTDSGVVNYLWRVINTFHMPGMIFISGYFAKRYIRKDGLNVQRPVTYAILYIASQIAVRCFERFVLGDKVAFSLFSAASSLWFLQCLFWWYLLLPLLDRFKPRYVMIFCILLGLFCGYDSRINNFLAFSRMMVHMPFFMAGYYISADSVKKLFTTKAKLLSVPALAVPLGAFYLLAVSKTPLAEAISKSTSRIITCSYNFWDMPALTDYSINPLSWWLLRLCFYVLAALLFFGFMVWVPRSHTWFTRFGSRTLQVYILHRFLYLADLKYEWWKPFNSTWGIVAMMLIAFATTVILSLKPFELPFTLLQGIKVKGLLKPQETTSSNAIMAPATQESPAVESETAKAADNEDVPTEDTAAAEDSAVGEDSAITDPVADASDCNEPSEDGTIASEDVPTETSTEEIAPEESVPEDASAENTSYDNPSAE